MTVEIRIIGEDAGHALRELSSLSRGLLVSTSLTPVPVDVAKMDAVGQKIAATQAAADESGQAAGFTAPTTETADEPGTRLRGKASGGRARRTKDEIAEDEQLEKLAAAAGVPIEQVDNALGNGLTREKVISELEAKAAKGNMGADPENRVGPEDDAETQAQDEADEQAEVENNREPEKPLTVDDVRSVMGRYVEKFQLPATQEDGPGIFVDALGAPPAGEQSWKLSLLANADQATLRKAIDAWTAAANADKRYVAKGGA